MSISHCCDCGCELELCAFCDREGCGDALCFRCVRAELYPPTPELEPEAR